MTKQLYHLANIRELLTQGFDDRELRRLCYDVLDLRPEYGPARAGTLTDLFPAGDLPPSLRSKLRYLVWCDQAGDYVRMAHPDRLYLTPKD